MLLFWSSACTGEEARLEGCSKIVSDKRIACFRPSLGKPVIYALVYCLDICIKKEGCKNPTSAHKATAYFRIYPKVDMDMGPVFSVPR